MLKKHPFNTPNVLERVNSPSQLDRPVADMATWKLESGMPTPGPVKYDVAGGANGVIEISVSQLNGDVVDGWEMCYAMSDVTSPTGLAYTYETGGKFLIPANAARNVWVRPVIGLKKGAWQGYGEIPEGAEVFTTMFTDASFEGETTGAAYANTTTVFGHGLIYNWYGPNGIYNCSGYNYASASLFNANHTARHTALGGRIACTLWGGYADPSEIGFVFMARSTALSNPNDDFYVIALKVGSYSGGQYQYNFVLYYISGQTLTLKGSSSSMNSYGTYLGNGYEGLNGVLELPCIIDRNGSVFTVRNAADTTTLWTITDTTIAPDDTRIYVGTYQYHSNGHIRPALTVSKRNYAGSLSVINPGAFVDPINEANLTVPTELSHYIRMASDNTTKDALRMRWDNNLDLIAERDRPAGTLQETVKIPEMINSETTITVKTSGGDFTTIQAAWDYLKSKTISAAVTIQVDSGSWFEEGLVLSGQPYGNYITISGDTRTNAGQAFLATGSITKDGTTCTITLVDAVPGDWAAGDCIVVCGALTSSANMGVFPIVGNVGSYTINYTNSSGVAEAVLGATYVVLCPNRTITRSGSGDVVKLISNHVKMTGFTILGAGSSGSGIVLDWVSSRNVLELSKTLVYSCISYGVNVHSGTMTLGATCSIVNTTSGDGLFVEGGSTVWGSSSFSANNSAAGYVSDSCSRVFAASSKSVKNVTGYVALNQGYLYASAGTAKYNTTGYYAGNNALVNAPSTSSNCSNNTANYSPETSGTEGNTAAIVIYS